MASARRTFLRYGGVIGAATLLRPTEARAELKEKIDTLSRQPVLNVDFAPRPVVVASIELLQQGKEYLLRTRSKDGLEVITAPNPSRMAQMYPILLRGVIPTFLNKDARTLESLLWEVYRAQSNYKLQGIALWAPVAAVEMGLLELLGQATQRPIADFFGGRHKTDVPIYVASGERGNTPTAEIEHLQKLVAESGAKALKFRLGGRMNRSVDSLPGRTEALIKLTRQSFGSAMTLYADSNSSYDAAEAIRIGRLMEEQQFGFYEEPCEFDDLWSTKQVADALTIPVAGGEQEYSMHRWRWMIEHRGVDIVQPDLHYGGGFIRATQVARMAAAAGMTVVPHMSGGGLGYMDVVHFASFTPNIGPHMEFKGNASLPARSATSELKSSNGVVRCPTGPGFGIEIDPAFVAACKVVKAS